jgi:hypothetical protein
MNDVQMHPDDYILWLKGMFDTIGDRTPTPEEWERFRAQNIMQVGDVVMRRVEEREIAQKELMRRAEQEVLEKAKRDAYEKWRQQQINTPNPLFNPLKPIQPLTFAAGTTITGTAIANQTWIEDGIVEKAQQAHDAIGKLMK